MNIFLNNIPTNLPDEISTIKELIEWKQIPSGGTAVALNDKLIKQDNWNLTKLQDNDQVTIISAAFGG